MDSLKPCPFCGKYPQAVVDYETEEKFGVKCFNCGGSICPEKETLQEAIEAWNRRAGERPEIIQCKDCKHNLSSPEAGNACCDIFYGMTDQYGFCHMGEKRGE